MSEQIKVDDIVKEVSNTLMYYSRNVITGLDEKSKKAIEKLVAKTKATAPVGRRNKHYKENITSKQIYNSKQTKTHLWYVKAPDYRLSHLLNNGHAKKNGGRVEGTNFIGIATEEVLEEYEKDIEEVIKNG